MNPNLSQPNAAISGHYESRLNQGQQANWKCRTTKTEKPNGDVSAQTRCINKNAGYMDHVRDSAMLSVPMSFPDEHSSAKDPASGAVTSHLGYLGRTRADFTDQVRPK